MSKICSDERFMNVNLLLIGRYFANIELSNGMIIMETANVVNNSADIINLM